MDYPATFIATLFHSGTNAHFMHLQTDSYARHVALGDYYDEIIDLVDKYAEAFQGSYEIIKSYPKDFHIATDPVKYIKSIKEFVIRRFSAGPSRSKLAMPNPTSRVSSLDDIDTTACCG